MANIRDLREKNKPVKSKSIKDFTRDWYQSSEWRTIREEYRKKVREKHEQIVFKVYEDNPQKNEPEDLIEFLTDPKEYPLSELSLKQGIIKRATVCDHIKEVRLGGSKSSHDNLQWITKEEHYKKTQGENRREYE